MSEPRDAEQILESDFLTTRHRILDVASALDRMSRTPNADDAKTDARVGKIEQALGVLTDGRPGRAERIQMVFSRAYDPNWNG